MDPELTTFFELLGTSLDGELFTEFVAALGTSPVVEQIGEMLYLEFPERGVAVTALLSKQITTIQLYSEGYQGYHQYQGCILDRITFASTQSDVRKIFGPPSQTSEGSSESLIRRTLPWNRYDTELYVRYFRYHVENRRLVLYTMVLHEFAPE
jgi:hypothetical protein